MRAADPKRVYEDWVNAYVHLKILKCTDPARARELEEIQRQLSELNERISNFLLPGD